MQRYFTALNNKGNILNKFTDIKMPACFVYICFCNILFCGYFMKKVEQEMQPTAAFLPGESHRQRSLVGCRLWGHTESDTTEAT